jgi:hypothetical protein
MTSQQPARKGRPLGPIPTRVPTAAATILAGLIALPALCHRRRPAAASIKRGCPRGPPRGDDATPSSRGWPPELFQKLGLSIGQAIFLLFAYRVLAQTPERVGLIFALGGVAGLAEGQLSAPRSRQQVLGW